MGAAHTWIIGIGAQKAATTWLARYLAQHPDIFISPISEMHFFEHSARWEAKFQQRSLGFDKRLIRKGVAKSQSETAGKGDSEAEAEAEVEDDVSADPEQQKHMSSALKERAAMNGEIERYRQYFESRVGSRPVMGEITPSYALLSQTQFEQIRSLGPEVRLIFIMRNPADRLWSQMRMRAERIDTVGRASAEERALRKLNKGKDSLRSEYERTLETVSRVFEPRQVFVGFFETLHTEQEMRRLMAHIGCRFIAPDFEARVNESRASDLDPDLRARLVERFADSYRWAAKTYGEALPASWRTDLDSLGSLP